MNTLALVGDVPASIDPTIPVIDLASALASRGLTAVSDGRGGIRITRDPHEEARHSLLERGMEP